MGRVGAAFKIGLGILTGKIRPVSSTSGAAAGARAYHDGGYGGGYGGSMSAGGKWPFSPAGMGGGIHLNHTRIRQHARRAMHDSPDARAIIERKVDAISGTGLRLEPTPDAGILGITQETATEWAKDVSSRFSLWATDKKAHRSEVMTFNQAQWLYTLFKERDNDIFVRLMYSADTSLQNPLQFGFLDPDQIRGYAYTSSYGGHHQEDGIERDARGRETGYKIQIYNREKKTYEQKTIPARGSRSGRIFMLHGYRPEYAGQGRGLSKLAPVLQDMMDWSDYKSAHIIQAKSQASITGFVEPSNDADASAPFEGLATAGGAGPAGDSFAADGAEDVFDRSGFECYEVPEATFSRPAGYMIQDLAKGETIKFANPNAPITSYDRFSDAFVGGISSALGTPIEVVKFKFANNFSASRATLLLFQRVIELERDDMVADFCGPAYEMWLSGEIAAGRVIAPGWNDPRLRRAWLKATWGGTPVPDIDPKKLADARETNLLIGATNAEREAQQHSGMSAADNIAINNREYANYEPLPFKSSGAAPAEPESPGGNPNDDEESEND